MRNLYLSFLVSIIMYFVSGINHLVIPIKENLSDRKILAQYFLILRAPESKVDILSDAVSKASKSTGVSPILLIALMRTESNFNPKAISSKGYKGVLQTPWAFMDWEHIDLDVLHGAMVFKEKLKLSKGDMLLALSLYKGGNNSSARRYANETLELYQNLQKSTSL